MKKKQDIKADKNKAEDRGETISAMDPLLISHSNKHHEELADLALVLTAKSTALKTSLPEGLVNALADLVRAMNCYYSNLIEGHDTHPIDIERALNDDYSADPKKRNLQLEARAHIETQAWIDQGSLKTNPTTIASIIAMHEYFCALLPEDLRHIENPDTGERIALKPGEIRLRDVAVGKHIPVSPGALPRFMRRFEDCYAELGRVDSIIAAATAHHRFLWLHPFLDGNGRVARLMSYAMLRNALDTGGIWSIARGLARNEAVYKKHLAACDAPRRGDLDGRGNLSETALAGFAKFFLETCIDQVDFMQSLMQPDRLMARILIWAEEEIRIGTLPAKSGIILEALLYRGALPRGDVSGLLGTTDRTARRTTSTLLEIGVLKSQSSRAPLYLAFPAKLAARWMPGLFPDR